MMSRNTGSRRKIVNPLRASVWSVRRFISVPLRRLHSVIASRTTPSNGSELRTCSKRWSVPDGANTRRISASARSGSGTEQSVHDVTTVSKVDAANGRHCASAASSRTRAGESPARRRARSSIDWLKSRAVMRPGGRCRRSNPVPTAISNVRPRTRLNRRRLNAPRLRSEPSSKSYNALLRAQALLLFIAAYRDPGQGGVPGSPTDGSADEASPRRWRRC